MNSNFLRDSSPGGTNSSSNTTTSSSVTYQPLPPQQQQQQAKFPGYPQYNTQHRLPTVSSAVYEKRPPLGPAARSTAYPGARPTYTTLGPARSGSAMGGSASQSQAAGAKQFDSYYYHPATLRPNHHQNSNATSQYRGGAGGLDYADISIQQQQQQQQQNSSEHHPQHQHPHLAGRGNNTDYEVLQFNKTSDVGKEIDV